VRGIAQQDHSMKRKVKQPSSGLKEKTDGLRGCGRFLTFCRSVLPVAKPKAAELNTTILFADIYHVHIYWFMC